MYGYFRKKALYEGDYKNNVNEQPGSASLFLIDVVACLRQR